jgi:hypothetical protein
MISAHTNCTDARPLNGVSGCLRFVVLLSLVATIALSATRSASASCGDYLFRNGRPVSSHSLTMNPVTRGQADNSETGSSPIQVPFGRCSGPNCSSSPVPLTPVPTAPSTLIMGFDQAAVLEALAGTCTNSGAIQIPESERGARFEPSTIFRPPAAQG